MKTAPHQRLLRLQRRIFQTLRNESIQLLGETPKSIWRYEKEFKSDFRRRSQLTSVSKSDLIEAIRRVPVTFIGDFHTFAQAQKTALRLIRDCFNEGERGLIGLEMVQSRFQSELDQFQAGRLSLPDFLRAIRYSDEWGFPWKHYAPIFDWAREKGFQLIALNQPKEFRWSADPWSTEDDERELQARDRWAAGVITDRFGKNGKIDPNLRMIVLYGEMHVAHPHLPRQLEAISKGVYGEPIRSVTIHQNYDPLFWQLSQERDPIQNQIFKLNGRTYCVFSGTPWTKLQSVIAWVEGSEEENSLNESPNELNDEVNPDLLSWVKTSGTVIGEFLRCAVPSFESLNIRTIKEIDFIEDLRADGGFS